MNNVVRAITISFKNLKPQDYVLKKVAQLPKFDIENLLEFQTRQLSLVF